MFYGQIHKENLNFRGSTIKYKRKKYLSKEAKYNYRSIVCVYDNNILTYIILPNAYSKHGLDFIPQISYPVNCWHCMFKKS